MYSLPQQPSSIGKILDQSFRLFAEGFPKVIGFSLILALIGVVFTLQVGHLSVQSVPAAQPPDEDVGALVARFAAVIVAYIVVSFVFYGAILVRLDNLVRQHPDTFTGALGVAGKRLPALLLATLLYPVAVVLGSVLLLVPGVILMMSLSLYPVIVIVEERGGYAALKASHQLIWGLWWRTVSIYMVPGILMMIFYTVVIGIGVWTTDATAQPGSFGFLDILSNVVSGLVMPYFYALAYVVYHDLRLRKSGADLAQRLAR